MICASNKNAIWRKLLAFHLVIKFGISCFCSFSNWSSSYWPVSLHLTRWVLSKWSEGDYLNYFCFFLNFKTPKLFSCQMPNHFPNFLKHSHWSEQRVGSSFLFDGRERPPYVSSLKLVVEVVCFLFHFRNIWAKTMSMRKGAANSVVLLVETIDAVFQRRMACRECAASGNCEAN